MALHRFVFPIVSLKSDSRPKNADNQVMRFNRRRDSLETRSLTYRGRHHQSTIRAGETQNQGPVYGLSYITSATHRMFQPTRYYRPWPRIASTLPYRRTKVFHLRLACLGNYSRQVEEPKLRHKPGQILHYLRLPLHRSHVLRLTQSRNVPQRFRRETPNPSHLW